MIRVYLAEKISDSALEVLRCNGIQIKLGECLDEAYTLEMLKDCDAVIVRILKITRNIIEANPQIKLISKHGVGCDSIDLEAAKEHNVTVCFTPGANSVSVAEHIISLIFSFNRKILESANEYKSGNYNIKNFLSISEITGKTIGLIGFGNIGRQVAKILHYGFDMCVYTYDPYVAINEIPSYVTHVKDLDFLLKESDYISLHMPSTINNFNFISYREFSLMKKSCVIINSARGELIDNLALIDALSKNRIRGALLDVTYPEPLEIDHRLFSFRNVIITPHCGAISDESMERMGLQCVKNIIDFFNDKDIDNKFLK